MEEEFTSISFASLTIPALLDNEYQNPFFRPLGYFLQRQTILNGQIAVLNQSTLNNAIEMGNGIYDETGSIVITKYEISYSKPENLERLKSQIYLMSLSLSVENFETYIKQVIREILEIIFSKNSAFEDFAATHKTNRERIKFLRKYSQAIDKLFSIAIVENYCDVYLLCEQVRHITIHSDHVVKEKDKAVLTQPSFKKYFSTNSDIMGERIILEAGNADDLIDNISSLAYIIFKGICQEHSYPIKTANLRPFK